MLKVFSHNQTVLALICTISQDLQMNLKCLEVEHLVIATFTDFHNSIINVCKLLGG